MGAVLDGWFPVLEGIDFLFQFLDGTVQTFDFRKPVLQQIPDTVFFEPLLAENLLVFLTSHVCGFNDVVFLRGDFYLRKLLKLLLHHDISRSFTHYNQAADHRQGSGHSEGSRSSRRCSLRQGQHCNAGRDSATSF